MKKKIILGSLIVSILIAGLFILTGCEKNIITEENSIEEKELITNETIKPAVKDGMIEKTIGELTYQYPDNIRFLDYKSDENTHMFHLYPLSEEKTIVNLYVEKYDAKGRKIEDITTGVYLGLSSETDLTGTKEINGATWSTAHRSYYSRADEADYEAYGYGIIIDGTAYHVSIEYEKGVEETVNQAKKIEDSLWLERVYR